MLASIAVATTIASIPQAGPVRLKPGPHLFLDDGLIASSRGMARRVNRPERTLPDPVVTGAGDGCFQPYVTVLRNPGTHRFRIWYGVPENAGQSHLATMESTDGIHWERPRRVLRDPSHIQFGISILDEGPGFADPARRYRYGYYGGAGLAIATSPDGLEWTPLRQGTVLPHDHDINCIYRDPIRHRYGAIVSTYREGPTWTGKRRVPMQSVSANLLDWSEPRVIIGPDAKDEGETQYYSMSAIVARGDLLVGMLRVLRDDLPADAGGPVAGIGYTALAWSHDGVHWQHDREAFLDRDPRQGAWDHAMAWIGDQLPVGDQVYLYYGGYARGHKVERFTERQIGLVRMPRDRYVAREAGAAAGRLTTRPVLLEGRVLTLNADARGGRIRAQVLDARGRPAPGFTFADCRPITGDDLNARLTWRRSLSALRGVPVRLEFEIRGARLFALGVL